MPISTNDQQSLKQIHSEYGKTYGGLKEDYFALLYLRKKFKMEPEEIGHQVAFGNRDYGVDAFYIDRKAGNLYLYQFKWTEDFSQFKASMQKLVSEGLPRIFGNPTADRQQNPFLAYLEKDLDELRNAIDRVYIVFVFKGSIDDAERSEALAYRKEELESKQHLCETFFGHPIELRVEFESDRPSLGKKPPAQNFQIRMEQAVSTTYGTRTMYVGFVRLIELYGIYSALNQQFFERNIRAALSKDNAPNRKLRDAFNDIVIKGVVDPQVFAFRHNGVTIAAERAALDQDVIQLHVPRLLNGAQTVSSLGTFLADKSDNPLLKTNADRLESIQVLAKVIVDDLSGNFITEVTIANNQQNPVHPWALRAMDRVQSDLVDRFRELKIFYSRQEGAFENLTREEREELDIEDNKDIRIRPLAQTFLAAQGEIDKMSRLPDVFESSKIYQDTFKRAYTLPSTDPRKIVLAYKVGLMLNAPMEKLRELAAQKSKDATSRARNLTWALLIQGLLNDDDNLESDLEEYGKGLTKEHKFRERLVGLIGKRVLPILREIFLVSAYAEKMTAGKYDFLRTAEAFKKAMDIADKKYGWHHRALNS